MGWYVVYLLAASHSTQTHYHQVYRGVLYHLSHQALLAELPRSVAQMVER